MMMPMMARMITDDFFRCMTRQEELFSEMACLCMKPISGFGCDRARTVNVMTAVGLKFYQTYTLEAPTTAQFYGGADLARLDSCFLKSYLNEAISMLEKGKS